MSKLSSTKIFIFPLSMLCITLLASIIAMLPSTSADISPIDDDITITVDSACTMGQTVLRSSNTLNPGETSTIGSSRIAAYCNDSEGYAIYAIGYTNGEYGNTNLISAQNPNHTIPTGTSSTLGNASYWNMSLTPGTSTTSPSFIPTIENNFTTSSNIPANFTKVASYPSTTISQQQDPVTSGSYFTTTYQSHISTTQPAGTYNGAVQYVMVHPTTAMPPVFMQDTDTIKSLLANYGDTMQAIDKRDGKKYWVTRLADGNIWMTQNLDLDIDASKTYTSADTDLLEGETWTPSAEITTWSIDNHRPHLYNPGEIYVYSSGTAENDNVYSSLLGCQSAYSDCSMHNHVGNYYNWPAAVASNDTSSLSGYGSNAPNSICPAGWELPTGTDGNGNYKTLLLTENIMTHDGSNFTGYTADGFNKIRTAPLWLARFGSMNYYSSPFIGNVGYYWSSTIYNYYRAYYLHIDEYSAAPTYYDKKMGFSVRCVAR